jgi:hypothetical protein
MKSRKLVARSRCSYDRDHFKVNCERSSRHGEGGQYSLGNNRETRNAASQRSLMREPSTLAFLPSTARLEAGFRLRAMSTSILLSWSWVDLPPPPTSAATRRAVMG